MEHKGESNVQNERASEEVSEPDSDSDSEEDEDYPDSSSSNLSDSDATYRELTSCRECSRDGAPSCWRAYTTRRVNK